MAGRAAAGAANAALPPWLLLLPLLVWAPPAAGRRPPVHIFSYADRLHPNLCALASSVEAVGGRLNVLGLEDDESAGAVPVTALDGLLATLARHGLQPHSPRKRFAAPVTCTTAAECAGPEALFKVRKLFSLWPHLEDFGEDEVLLFLDGFDTVLEVPSLEHLRGSFERLQARLAPLVGGPPGGPVIFNGEGNCWPFPHSGPVSGDYRPSFEYELGNGTRLKGKDVCEFWRRASDVSFAAGGLGDGAAPGAIHLPFLNSGAFIGRVRSLRRLFEFLSDLLHRFADFDDQALVYAAALVAGTEKARWAPVWVDTHGELLASLHGLDLELLARRLGAPQICDYHGRVYFGYYGAALETASRSALRPSRWSPRRQVPPPPAVLHFNGDKKFYFDSKCSLSAAAQAAEAGVDVETCRVVSYPLRTEYRWSRSGGQGGGKLALEQRRVHMPRPHVTLCQNQVLAAGALGLTTAKSARLLLAQAMGPQIVGPVRVGPAGSGGGSREPCASVGRHWRHPEPSTGAFAKIWQEGPPAIDSLDGLFVRRNETRCAGGGHAGGPGGPYCRLLEALRDAWQCLRCGVDGSPGLFWAEFSGILDFRRLNELADAGRPSRECSRDSAKEAGGAGPCPGQAVMDFVLELPQWEVAHFRYEHRLGMSMLFAIKLPAW